QRHPDPPEGPVRQGALWGCKLDHAQHERRHGRAGMEGNFGSCIEQWRKAHNEAFRSSSSVSATGRPRSPAETGSYQLAVAATLQATRLVQSERNIIIHVAVAGAGGGDRAARRTRRSTGAEVASGIVGANPAATAAAIQHGQVRVEALQHHFGRVFFGAALVGPFAGLQLAFNVNLGTLFQILPGNLAEPFVEDHDPMPLGLFLALAGRLVAPVLGGRNAEICNRPSVLGAPDFRILAEISNQNHLVYTSSHCRSPLSNLLDVRSADSATASRP